MDYSRKFDLEEITKGMRNARSYAEKERYEKLMWKIMGESEPIGVLRRQLVEAVTAGDTQEILRIQRHIHRVRQQETNGQSYGNVRAEGVDKHG